MKGLSRTSLGAHQRSFSILNGSIINEGSLAAAGDAAAASFQYPQRIDNQ